MALETAHNIQVGSKRIILLPVFIVLNVPYLYKQITEP